MTAVISIRPHLQAFVLKNLAFLVIAIMTAVIIATDPTCRLFIKELGDRRDRHHDSSDQHQTPPAGNCIKELGVPRDRYHDSSDDSNRPHLQAFL